MKSIALFTHFLLFIAVCSPAVFSQAKNLTLSGKVISFEESFPLKGVTITVPGTKNSVTTAANGRFSIEVAPADRYLLVHLDGYEPQQIAITRSTEYEIVLRKKSGARNLKNP